jgi:cell division protein FtsB
VGVFLVLQYQFWFGDGGVYDTAKLQYRIESLKQKNLSLKERNQALKAEVLDLRQGYEAIEERSRTDLGLVKPGETFIQVIDRRQH